MKYSRVQLAREYADKTLDNRSRGYQSLGLIPGSLMDIVELAEALEELEGLRRFKANHESDPQLIALEPEPTFRITQ